MNCPNVGRPRHGAYFLSAVICDAHTAHMISVAIQRMVAGRIKLKTEVFFFFWSQFFFFLSNVCPSLEEPFALPVSELVSPHTYSTARLTPIRSWFPH